jgi:hypothetical protein
MPLPPRLGLQLLLMLGLGLGLKGDSKLILRHVKSYLRFRVGIRVRFRVRVRGSG